MDARTKKILDEENDPRILKAVLASALEFIEHQKSVIAEIEKENLQRAQATFVIEEQVKLLRRELFGKSSEKRLDDAVGDRPRDKSQTEALEFSRAAFPAPVMRDESEKGKAKGKNLPKITIEHYPSAAQLNAEAKTLGVKN